MSEIYGPSLETFVPDDLTLPQFILDSSHPLRPIRPSHVPWFIEDAGGRGVGHEEVRCVVHSHDVSNIDCMLKVRARTYGLANGLSLRFRVSEFRRKCHDP